MTEQELEDLEQATRDEDRAPDEDSINYHEIRDEVWVWEGDEA